MASGGNDTTIALWDLIDPAHPRQPGKPLAGYNSLVLSAAFCPDGRTLASGSGDDTVLLWNVTDRHTRTRSATPCTDIADTCIGWLSVQTVIRWRPAVPITPCSCGT